MKQRTLAAAVLALCLLPASTVPAAAPDGRLITPREAARHGLTRAWFTQIRIDPGRSRISHLRLFDGAGQLPDTLFVQTDRNVIHALDAETGQTLWARAVGNEDQPTMAVGANAKLVGVVNGTRLYLLDRSDGRILWERRVAGVPSEGPTLADEYAFVPTISGRVFAYTIEEKQYEEEGQRPAGPSPPAGKKSAAAEEETPAPSQPQPADAEKPAERRALEQRLIAPLICVSFGRVTSQPILALDEKKTEYLAWSTPKGLFVGYVDPGIRPDFAVKYQLRTRSEIVSQPTYLPPAAANGNAEGLIFATSKMGEIYAISATGGTELWQYAVGQPILEPVIPIGDRVYVVTQLGTLFCFEVLTGREYWSSQGIGQFIAASKEKIYAANRAGDIEVLDARSGTHEDGLAAAEFPLKFHNLWTDRIYLATPTGLVLCLRETAQVEPLRHQTTEQPRGGAAEGKEAVPAKPGKPAAAQKQPSETPKPAEGNPFE